MAARHRAFIAPRLLGSFAALAAFPVYLIVRGVPSPLEVLVFAWFVVPILISYFLAQTGRYEGAQMLSSSALTVLVTAVCASTGGITSFAALWLAIVPLEAVLSASRRAVAVAAAFALGAAALLVGLGLTGHLPETLAADAARQSLAALGLVSGLLYATGLAFAVQALERTGNGLLNAEEDRYRLLAQHMSDVITRHGRNGAVLFISPAAEPLCAARCGDLLGHGLFDRVHVADRPAYLTALADAATLGEARSVEFRIRREASGAAHSVEFVWVEMRCRPLETDVRTAGSQEVVAVMRDMTARKAQEAALEEARAEAVRANASKGRFLATMSHELRTPLNAVIGFSDMLIQEEALALDAAKRKEYAQLINTSGQHLLSVVNGILDTSKLETGTFSIDTEPFAVESVIVGCCDLLALKAREAGIDFVLRIPSDLPEVMADKRAFNQILLNLFSNAIKFTTRGGKVSVGARPDGAMLLLTVEDTGVGIDDADLARVGDPFFQAKASYDRRHDGTGLGLSIVKGLIQLHGGTLEISSRVGQGTRVSVRLPLDREGTRARETRARPAIAFPMRQPESQVKKSA
jgi:cell cycle sensor histidine kinase DivJ